MSSKLFIFFLYFACVLKLISCDLNETDNLHQLHAVKPRVAGGYRPNNESLAKYVVSLRYRDETFKRFGYSHFCAGSIIASDKILTAAHCVYIKGKKISTSKIKVVAKTPRRLNRSQLTQEIHIKEIIIHSKFEAKTLFNDIAILILESNINLDLKMAAIIPLPKENIESETLCKVIGWGKLYMHGPLANEIVHVDLHLHSRKYCRKRFPKFSGKKICASNIYDKEKDACIGDSGGPLICSGVITGIVSYGYGCALGNAGIYTNVFKYLDWINKNGQKLQRPCLLSIVLSLIVNSI